MANCWMISYVGDHMCESCIPPTSCYKYDRSDNDLCTMLTDKQAPDRNELKMKLFMTLPSLDLQSTLKTVKQIDYNISGEENG